MNKCCEETIRKCSQIILDSIPNPLTIICRSGTKKKALDKLTPLVAILFSVHDNVLSLIPKEAIRIKLNRELKKKRRAMR